MNLTALITAVRTRIGVPSTDAFYTDTVVTAEINAALQYITSLGDWEWLEKSETIATVNATQSYNVAADAMRTIDVVDPNGIPLARRNIDEIDFMGTATGSYTRFYAQNKNALVVFPIPNGVWNLKHRYVASEPYLTGTDTPLMTAQWQESLIAYSAYLLEQRAGNVAQAEAHKTAFADFLSSMQTRADRRAVTTGGGQQPSQQGGSQ